MNDHGPAYELSRTLAIMLNAFGWAVEDLVALVFEQMEADGEWLRNG